MMLVLICTMTLLFGMHVSANAGEMQDVSVDAQQEDVLAAGAQCDHMNHVSTQLPYALTVAAVSFLAFLAAGLIKNVLIVLPVAILVLIAVLFIIKKITKKE